MGNVRRKVFVSYHHDDQLYVDEFIKTFQDDYNLIICRALGMTEDIIYSSNPEYVMSQISQKYLLDSTITIVLIGQCTWSRRYVDWEIKASLRQGDVYIPNGLVGIYLKHAGALTSIPERLEVNLPNKYGDGYARLYSYPEYRFQLQEILEDAFKARTTRNHLIENSQEMFRYNRNCQ